MDFNALSAGLSAAAPGAKQGIQNLQVSHDQNVVGQQAPAMASQAAQDISNNPAMQVQPLSQNQMQDPSHPFWGVMQQVASGGQNPTQMPPTGAIPTQAPPTQAMQNGGVVRANFGKKTVTPEFTKGPALPTGPNATAIPVNAQAPQALANGGMVTEQVGVGRDASGIGYGVNTPSTEGQVLTMAEGGAVPFQQASGINVPMTGGAAGFSQGLAQGQTLGHNLFEAFQAHEQRKAAAEGASAALTDPSQVSGQDQTSQPSLIDKARDSVEGFFHHLHEGTLNDQHQPNGTAPPIPSTGAAPSAAPQPAAAPPATGQQAIPAAGPTVAPPAGAPTGPAAPAGAAPPAAAAPPSPQQAQAATQKIATATAAGAASQDASANAGVPQQTPEQSGKPHSLTPDYWEQSNQKIKQAVVDAARAGEDPSKVYTSLTAMRTAHFQGQILRQLSAANTALLNGDQDSVKQALSNVNYYLPNGKGITFKTATAQDATADKTGQTQPGQLLYRNPMAGLYGHQGEPEYISVTPQHIQLLGAAALDPQTVQSTMLKTYSAQAQAQKELLGAQGEFLTGQGRQLWGQAAQTKATVDQQMVPVEKFLKFATGEKNEAEAGYYNRKQDKGATGLGPKVTMASVQKAQKDTMEQFDNLSRGLVSAVPVKNPDGTTNLSTAAGRNVNDPGRIPTLFQGLSPDQQAAGRALAASIGSANVGTINSGDASEIAARIVRAEGAKQPPTHADPTTKKITRDVVYDKKANTVHVWVGNGWKSAYVHPNVIDAESDQGIPADSEDPSDNEPARDPTADSQNMN